MKDKLLRPKGKDLNALFLAQSQSLKVFHGVAKSLHVKGKLRNTAFYVSDARFFEQYLKTHPEIEDSKPWLLKEWEITKASADVDFDPTLLQEYEERFGVGSLWNAIVADRRIFGGTLATLRQDYQPRYSHERMLSLLMVTLSRFEVLFKEFKPELVVAFQGVTIGEYIASLFANEQGIPFVNLRPARIQNLMYAGESVYESSPFLRWAYGEQRRRSPTDNIALADRAETYLRQVRNEHGKYEGVIEASSKPPSLGHQKPRTIAQILHRAIAIAKEDFRLVADSEVAITGRPALTEMIWESKVARPLRTRRVAFALRNDFVTLADLHNTPFAFFPLHTEPEVQINVCNKLHLNQIEAVRLIARSLPVEWKLVVKEHPWSVGRRPASYYRKLLEIPNVLLSYPAIGARDWIVESKLVTVISSSVGFEAAVLGKPVVSVGHPLFNILPSHVIRHASNLEGLSKAIGEILGSYRYDEEALRVYVETVMKHSIGIDWYSRLLGRPEAYRSDAPKVEDSEGEYLQQIEALGEYLLLRSDLIAGFEAR